jgi:cytochrome c553
MRSRRRSPALAWLALLPVALLSQQPAQAGDRALGEYLSAECVTCHQISGRQVGGIPAIIGLPEEAFVALMESYRRRERDNQVMQAMAARLSPEEVAALAAYFGGLKLRN